MDKIKIIHDVKGNTLTIWLGDPDSEYVCDETQDEIILMKNRDGKLIGLEILHYSNIGLSSLIVETILKAA